MKLIPILLRYPIPIYRENLNKVFSEEYIAEDEDLKPIIDLVLAQNWEDSKEFKPIYYRIRRDLFLTPTNAQLSIWQHTGYTQQNKTYGVRINSSQKPRAVQPASPLTINMWATYIFADHRKRPSVQALHGQS